MMSKKFKAIVNLKKFAHPSPNSINPIKKKAKQTPEYL